jgi:hypothetical protein
MGGKKRIVVEFREGTCFLVPLRAGGCARGVVARLDREGRMFAYFFGPKLSGASEASFDDLRRQTPVLVGLCGDLGIVDGEWPIVQTLSQWDRVEWPMPPLFRVDDTSGEAWLSHYDEETLDFITQDPAEAGDEDKFPEDLMMGYGSVAIRLTRLLEERARVR